MILRTTRCLGVLAGGLLCASVHAQTTAVQSNAWASFNLQAQVSDRWWIVHEEQFRRSKGFADPMQTGFLFAAEHRQGAWTLQPGYAYWLNYPYGYFTSASTQREHRFWLQAFFKHGVGRWSLEHRLRIEDRFLERFTSTPEGIRSQGFLPVYRLRYRAQLTIPLNKHKDVAGEWTGVLSEEMLIRFGDPTFIGLFDQSRSIAQLAWRPWNNVRLLSGYQFQYLVRANNAQREANHTFLIAVQVRFPKISSREKERPAGDDR